MSISASCFLIQKKTSLYFVFLLFLMLLTIKTRAQNETYLLSIHPQSQQLQWLSSKDTIRDKLRISPPCYLYNPSSNLFYTLSGNPVISPTGLNNPYPLGLSAYLKTLYTYSNNSLLQITSESQLILLGHPSLSDQGDTLQQGRETWQIQDNTDGDSTFRRIAVTRQGQNDPILNFLQYRLITHTFRGRQWIIGGHLIPNPVHPDNSKLYDFYNYTDSISDQPNSAQTYFFKPSLSGHDDAPTGFLHIDTIPPLRMQIATVVNDTAGGITVYTVSDFLVDDTMGLLPTGTTTIMRFQPIHNEMIITGVNHTRTLKFSYDIEDFYSGDSVLNSFKSSPQHLADSLLSSSEQQAHFSPTTLQRQLKQGFVPLAFTDIIWRKLIAYNDFEGFKFGIGFRTNQKFSQRFRLAAETDYGLWTSRFNYHYALSYLAGNRKNIRLSLHHAERFLPSGVVGFDAQAISILSEGEIKSFYVSRMDFTKALEAETEIQLSNNLSLVFKYSWQRVDPAYDYFFESQNNRTFDQFSYHELSTKIGYRWNHPKKRHLSKLPVADQVIFKFTLGTMPFLNNKGFGKLEVNLVKNLFSGRWSNWYLESTAGLVSEKIPAHKMFNLPGTWSRIGLFAPGTFSTMRPNEFTSSKFLSFGLNHQLKNPMVTAGFLQPKAGFSFQTVFGSIASPEDHHGIRLLPPDKGFFEAGIYLHELINTDVMKLGASIHFRIGAYRRPGQQENVAFKILISDGNE